MLAVAQFTLFWPLGFVFVFLKVTGKIVIAGFYPENAIAFFTFYKVDPFNIAAFYAIFF